MIVDPVVEFRLRHALLDRFQNQAAVLATVLVPDVEVAFDDFVGVRIDELSVRGFLRRRLDRIERVLSKAGLLYL